MSVYTSVDAGDVNYVGITNNLARRAAEQLASKGIDINPIEGLSNLSRTDARAVEQVLIEQNGGPGDQQDQQHLPAQPYLWVSDSAGHRDLVRSRRSTAARVLLMPANVRVRPGLAFWIVCDLGFAVGIATHEIARVGTLVWIAEPTFDEQPTPDLVRQIGHWRWPVLFPLAVALRRQLVTAIGVIELPPELQSFPIMRSGNKTMGWLAFTEMGGVRQRLGAAKDPSAPIYKVVNDTRLKEMIVSGWRPEDEW